MEKFLKVLFLFIIALQSIFYTDSTSKYPIDTYHEGYRWTAQEANVYFDVSKKYYEISNGPTSGIATTENKDYDITVSVSYSWKLEINEIYKDNLETDYKENLVLRGKIIKCNDDKFVLKVYEEYQSFFGEEIKTLTFVREPTPGYVKYVKPE